MFPFRKTIVAQSNFVAALAWTWIVTILAASINAGLGTVAEKAVAAIGVIRAVAASAATATPTFLGTPWIATIGQVAVAAIPVFQCPCGFLPAIIRAGSAIFACLADSVVVTTLLKAVCSPVIIRIGISHSAAT